MKLFSSKEQRELDSAVKELLDAMKADFHDWNIFLKITIDAKSASKFPIETIEPIIRGIWVECYARSIVFSAKLEGKYKRLNAKVPNLSVLLPPANFESLMRQQRNDMGGVLGNLIREICEIRPEFLFVLEKHLEEPEVSRIKDDAKKEVQSLLDQE
jgi:hypothetical protein